MYPHTAKTKCRIFEKNIPRKGISGPQSQCPHSLWANYIFPRWRCHFCWRKYVDRSWEDINRSQTHECGNWGWGRAIPRKGMYKRNCRCSVGTWGCRCLFPETIINSVYMRVYPFSAPAGCVLRMYSCLQYSTVNSVDVRVYNTILNLWQWKKIKSEKLKNPPLKFLLKNKKSCTFYFRIYLNLIFRRVQKCDIS